MNPLPSGSIPSESIPGIPFPMFLLGFLWCMSPRDVRTEHLFAQPTGQRGFSIKSPKAKLLAGEQAGRIGMEIGSHPIRGLETEWKTLGFSARVCRGAKFPVGFWYSPHSDGGR